MRSRSVPVVLSCAAVALVGCGGSSLLDGSTASDLQDSLGRVQTAIDEGQCSEARSAATAGLERVDALPSDVDGELRDRLRTGFQELSARVGSDCESTTTDQAPPTTTSTTTTDTAPTAPSTPEPSTPDPTPTTDTPSTPTIQDPPADPIDPVDPGDDDDDDGSGGVVPGVDGPGASERSAPRSRGASERLRELRERVEEYFRGRGNG